MYYLLDLQGQTGNQLRSLSSLIGLGIEENQKIYCPDVDNVIFQYFNCSSLKCNIDIRFYKSWFSRFSKVYMPFLKYFLRPNKNGIVHVSRNNMLILDWISFAKPELLNKHYGVIKEYLGFKPEFVEHCKGLFPPINKTYIGVHIRRGDYLFWNNGRYYFGEAEYSRLILKLSKEMDNLHFVIFTNENLDEFDFDKLGVSYSIMRGSAMEDLCCMSFCDYIVGPPSTFSCWAGYIGDRKLLWMRDRDVEYGLSDFVSVVDSMKDTLDFWYM